MNTNRKEFVPFKDRLKLRRVCVLPGRRTERRSRVFNGRMATMRAKVV